MPTEVRLGDNHELSAGIVLVHLEGHSLATTDEASRKTTIKLVGFKSDFREKCPKSAQVIARRIIEHCLEHFVLKTCPAMRLHDPAHDESPIDLQKFFKREMEVQDDRPKRQEFGKEQELDVDSV